MVAREQVPVDVENDARYAAPRGAADGELNPGAAATAAPLQVGGKRQLRSAAASRPLAEAQPRQAGSQIGLDLVVARIGMEAVQLVPIAGEVVQLALTCGVLGVEPVRGANGGIRRGLEEDVATGLEQAVVREGEERAPVHHAPG